MSSEKRIFFFMLHNMQNQKGQSIFVKVIKKSQKKFFSFSMCVSYYLLNLINLLCKRSIFSIILIDKRLLLTLVKLIN
jgi:hypothetical protein